MRYEVNVYLTIMGRTVGFDRLTVAEPWTLRWIGTKKGH